MSFKGVKKNQELIRDENPTFGHVGRPQLSSITSPPKAPNGQSAEVCGKCSLSVAQTSSRRGLWESSGLPLRTCGPRPLPPGTSAPGSSFAAAPRAPGWGLCRSLKVGARVKGESCATRGLGGRGGGVVPLLGAGRWVGDPRRDGIRLGLCFQWLLGQEKAHCRRRGVCLRELGGLGGRVQEAARAGWVCRGSASVGGCGRRPRSSGVPNRGGVRFAHL